MSSVPRIRIPDAVQSVLRLDCDMYSSTIDALTNLYPRFSRGGYVMIDDYSYCLGVNEPWMTFAPRTA